MLLAKLIFNCFVCCLSAKECTNDLLRDVKFVEVLDEDDAFELGQKVLDDFRVVYLPLFDVYEKLQLLDQLEQRTNRLVCCDVAEEYEYRNARTDFHHLLLKTEKIIKLFLRVLCHDFN